MKITIMKMYLISLAIILGLASCKKTQDEPVIYKPIEFTARQKQIISSSNSFGFQFFRTVNQFCDSSENIMVSPLSVSMAFGMTRNGANGRTLDSLNTTLGFTGMSDQEINESYRTILETFTNLDPKVKLSIANSIWYRNSFTVESTFIDVNKTYFNAEVSSMDFNDPESVNVINSWVSEKTNELIPSIIESIPSEMVMYLINAIYYKGEWKYKFDQNATSDELFYLSDGSSVNAPAMKQTTNLKIFSGNGFDIAELPYNQGNFNMSVILPDIATPIQNVVDQLTSENWNQWQNLFTEKEVQLQLPKFKYSYDEKKMNEILSFMGMGIAFNPSLADFTRINSNGDLYISEVKHKTMIETNEEGSEAAAVTSVGVAITSLPETYAFIANRPFIFTISEKATGTILFIGVVNNPLQD